MKLGSARGKALLILEHTGSRWVTYEVAAFIQSCSGNAIARDCAGEDFDLLSTSSLPLPDAARKLQPGERIWVKVTYEFSYYRDYYGEDDVELEYHKQHVIKRRPAKSAGLKKLKF